MENMLQVGQGLIKVKKIMKSDAGISTRGIEYSGDTIALYSDMVLLTGEDNVDMISVPLDWNQVGLLTVKTDKLAEQTVDQLVTVLVVPDSMVPITYDNVFRIRIGDKCLYLEQTNPDDGYVGTAIPFRQMDHYSILGKTDGLIEPLNSHMSEVVYVDLDEDTEDEFEEEGGGEEDDV